MIFAVAKNTGPTLLATGWRAGQALSGSRGKSGNHEVAGKIGVITLAALPRNPINAVKSMTWRRFSVAVRVAQARKENREPVE
jgi:hypothetical protein